jgi:hypothetical protein
MQSALPNTTTNYYHHHHQILLSEALDLELSPDVSDKKKSKRKLMDKTKLLLGRKKSDAGKAERSLTLIPTTTTSSSASQSTASPKPKKAPRRTIVEAQSDFRKSSHELQEFLFPQPSQDDAAELTSLEGYTRYLELIKVGAYCLRHARC